jgi:predicted dehydrogenase
MADRVRVGVIGTSWFADLMHLPNLKSHPQAEIAAICGRNRERAGEMARKYGIPAVYTDYREMIETGDLHAVEVITPDDLHYPMTMAALDAGLHVLCEKPLALNAAQAEEMADKAAAAGVVHMTFFTYRWLPHYRYLKELVDEGYVGRPFHCHMRYLAGYGRRPRYGWKWDRRRGLGALGDLGSHMIDMARWTCGEIVRVSAHLATFVERPDPEGRSFNPANDAAADAAMLLLEFAKAAQGMIQLSAVAHTADRNQEQHVTLHGAAGTLEVSQTGLGAEVRGARAEEKPFETLAVPDRLWEGVDRTLPFGDLFSAIFCQQAVGDRAFIDAILRGQPVTPSLYDGFKVQQVIDAAIASHERGTWVWLA